MLAIVQLLGALAGLGAGVGLVVLSALYVPHAREVERLREWAGRAPEQDAPPRRPRPRVGTRSIAVAVVGLIVVCGVYGLRQRPADPPPPAPKRRAVAVKPAAVTVAVLNGTTVDGLAATLRDQVAAAGFKRGTIDVFSDQQLAKSVVEYAPGHLAEAKAVGRIVGVRRYERATPDSRALAGAATVIVIAGADKAP